MKYPQLVSGRAVSGVSLWLSAELEARGIDGPIYSRLVLSLLHRPLQINALDLAELSHCVNSEREGRRARKRSRPPAAARLTATVGDEDELGEVNRPQYRVGGVRGCNKGSHTSEHLKRCAAVQCLIQAADQNSGIEPLVDELCAKLREIESIESPDFLEQQTSLIKEGLGKVGSFLSAQHEGSVVSSSQGYCLSPSELASKYYAAFPALSGLRRETDITLYPNRQLDSVWSTSCNNKVKTRTSKKKNQYKMWKETDVDRKQKSASKKSRSKSFCMRKMPQWDTDWEMGNEELLRDFIKNQCPSGNENTSVEISCSKDNNRFYHDLDEVSFNREWIKEQEISQKMERTDLDDLNVAKFEAKFNENVEALWSKCEEKEDNFDEMDLPVDFQELLSSPSDRLFDNECANEAKKSFIQAGTNLTNSIWSEHAVAADDEKSFYPKNSVDAANEYKQQLEMARSFWDNSEDLKNNAFGMQWAPSGYVINDIIKAKWSDNCNNIQQPATYSQYASLAAQYKLLNHNKELSCFEEVLPKTCSNMSKPQNTVIKINPLNVMKKPPLPDEDLLNSARTHFRPIKDDGYADGTTFQIPSTLDKVSFKRSDSGSLFLESDSDLKQYMIYKQTDLDDSDDDSRDEDNEFVIKFCVNQTEKYCQTTEDDFVEDILPEHQSVSDYYTNELYFPNDCNASRSFLTYNQLCVCVDQRYNSCPVHKDAEIQHLDSLNWCGKCNNNNNNANLQQIWSNKNVCATCNNDNVTNNKSNYNNMLRNELHKDGEEILNDLSYMQSLYIGSDWADDENMEEESAAVDLAPAEISYDVNKFISDFLKPNEILHLLKPTTQDIQNSDIILKQASDDVNKFASDCEQESCDFNMKNEESWKVDRKRRHSSTQRSCNEFFSGECKKAHCKFSHDISSIVVDNSCCNEQNNCPFQHSTVCPRPLTR